MANYGKGNIDLDSRPVVKNGDKISTVRSMGINVDGKEILIPTVSDDGKLLSNQEAIQQFKDTGKHLGQFDSVEESNAYAKQLHEDQASQYGSPTGIGDAQKLIKGQEVPPELQKKMDSYIASLMHVIHNPKTADGILEMLGSAPPEQSIPYTALYVNDAVEGSFGKKQVKVEDSVKMAGAMYLISDLSELGNAVKVWKDQKVSEQEVPKLLQKTMSQYIHKGIREGSIDPIQLQADTEPLLNDKQKQVGSTLQQKLGLPSEPTVSMGIDAYTKKKTAPLEEENKKLKQMLSEQQKAQAAQGQQNTGGLF